MVPLPLKKIEGRRMRAKIDKGKWLQGFRPEGDGG
jgi:hypothetical protein